MSQNQGVLPIVTVCMAAYNHEKYVQAAIQSIIDQDYPRLELVVIDDGSTDSTWEKIESMRFECEKRFERVVMYTRPNRGRSLTGRELQSYWRGDYITGIASDDRYLPGAISALVRVMGEDPSVGVAVGENIIMDSEGWRCYWDEHCNVCYESERAKYKTFDSFIEEYSGVDFSSSAFGDYSELVKTNHIPNGQIWRKSFVDQFVAFDDKAPLEDLWFNLQMAKVAKFRHVNVETFAYRWHGANTASQRDYMARIGKETYYRELQNLEGQKGSERWADAFLFAHPAFRKDVWKWMGKRYQLHLVRNRTWKHLQYVLYINDHVIPLTPKLRVAF